jgi:hypothetical protein
MRGMRSSRLTAAPQLEEERADDPKPPREVDPEELEERLDDDERVEEADPVLRPQPQPEERWIWVGP